MELVSLSQFLHNFWMKIFLLLYSINWRRFFVWLLLLREILGNMCVATVCWQACDVMKFGINLIFLTKLFFLHGQKVMIKVKYLENKKSFLDEIKSIFVILKELSMKQITQIFLEGENLTLIKLTYYIVLLYII